MSAANLCWEVHLFVDEENVVGCWLYIFVSIGGSVAQEDTRYGLVGKIGDAPTNACCWYQNETVSCSSYYRTYCKC